MFEVGFSELLLIMGLALLVLGPEKLPKLVGEIGRWMGRARAMARQFREQLEEESLENTLRRQHRDASATTPTSPPAAAAAATASSAEAPASTETAATAPEPAPFMNAAGMVDNWVDPTATRAPTDLPQPTETPPQDERRA
jgi:sec-independent protein translocase protein TatB